jgi:hypothetical protein
MTDASDAAKGIVVPRLTDNNYGYWSSQMEAYLIIKDLFDIVEDQAPEVPDADWWKRDKKVRAYMKMFISPHHCVLIKDAPSAKHAWAILESLYLSKSKARSLQLRQELTNIHLERYDYNITEYFARAAEIQGDLAAAGSIFNTEDVIMALMNGLPPAFESMRTIIMKDMGTTTFTVGEVQALIEQQKASMEHFDQKSDERAFFAHSKNVRCHYCQKTGHIKRNCRKMKADSGVQQYGENAQFAITHAF